MQPNRINFHKFLDQNLFLILKSFNFSYNSNVQKFIKCFSILITFVCLSNCAGSPSTTAAATSASAQQPVLTYVVPTGYAFVRPISQTVGVIVSGPATGGLAYFF